MNDGNFVADGIISPDQNYLPHTYIVKKVYQDILFEAKDIDKGIVTIINDFKFTDLTPANYSYKWVLLKNGEKQSEGIFDATVAAGSHTDVKLNLPPLKFESGVEYFLQIFAYSKEQTVFIPSGFEVAKAEFAFSGNSYFSKKEDRRGVLNIDESKDKITVKSGNLVYEFSKEEGKSLINMTNNGIRVFRILPKMNFWRAPIDNDFGEGVQYTLRLWDAANENIRYTYKASQNADGTFVVGYSAKPVGIEIEVDITYIVNKDGSLTVHADYKALSDNLPEMMRFGMLMTLPESVDNFTWYGRGPHENYVDRNADAFMGVWSGKVREQAHPYIRPQETGNKTEVRQFTLTDNNGKGIKISGLQPLSVSATNNRPEDLDPGKTKKQQHASDILPRKETVLCVDLFQRGVAGLNSWGAKPLEQYRFKNKEYKYGYTIFIIE